MAGFPLFAEGQVGALYPPNLLLFKFLPADLAISWSIVFHLAWASCGMYFYIRSLGLQTWSALGAGLVFSFSGFIFGHLSHPSVIAATSWLPWLILFLDQLQKNRNRGERGAIWYFLATCAIAVQFLAGSVQIAFLNALLYSAIGILGALLWNQVPQEPGDSLVRRVAKRLETIAVATVMPLLLGAAIAAVQLIPTAELIQYSVRGGTSFDFFASYSLSPSTLQGLFFPFFQGEPSEATGEFWPYVGFVPLLLAVAAPFIRRDRRTTAFVGLGLVALVLALGGNTPIYRLVYALPLFGMFRVPARYLLLFSFAVAVLCAIALDELVRRLASNSGRKWVPTLLLPLGLAAVVLISTQPLDVWLQVWRVMPFGLALGFGAFIWRARRSQTERRVLGAFVTGLVLVDLACFGAPFLSTIDSLTPRSYVDSVPRSISSLPIDAEPERILTEVSEFPSVPALRGSLFPNTALIYGWSSSQAYTSLSFARHELYMNNLSPAMVNLANIRYIFVPLEPRSASRSMLPGGSLAVDFLGDEIGVFPTRASEIRITSFTEQAAMMPDGAVVAEIDVRFEDGTVRTFPMRIGVDTADWDYDRKSALKEIAHSRGVVARSFPAYWRSFGRAFEGHDYVARFPLSAEDQAKLIVGIKVRPVVAESRLTVENVEMSTVSDQLLPGSYPLTLTNSSERLDLTPAFMSDTVAVWENKNRLPRALVVHQADVVGDKTAFERMNQGPFSPQRVVLLSEGESLTVTANLDPSWTSAQVTQYGPEQVDITAETPTAGYLLLTDSWYPGWIATVDGQPAPIYRADLIFRAVPIGPGRHAIQFVYRPISLIVGAGISIAGLIGTAAVALVLARAPLSIATRSS